MKFILILFLAIPLMTFTTDNDKEKFIGKWKGEDQGEFGYINFDEKGFAYIEIEGKIYGGEEFDYNGQKGMMTYEVNFDVNPIEVDFIVTKLDTSETKKLLCIAKFIDQDTMELEINFENIRPTNFNPKYSIIFTRVK